MTGRRIALIGTALAAEMIDRAEIATMHGHEPLDGFGRLMREDGPEGWHGLFPPDPPEPRPFHPEANTVETRQQRRHRLRKG